MNRQTQVGNLYDFLGQAIREYEFAHNTLILSRTDDITNVGGSSILTIEPKPIVLGVETDTTLTFVSQDPKNEEYTFIQEFINTFINSIKVNSFKGFSFVITADLKKMKNKNYADAIVVEIPITIAIN